MELRARLAIAALLILLVSACGERASDGGKRADGQVLRWAIGPEDEDEKPENVLANLPINVAWNLFDPLLKVDDDLSPVPSVAERWEWSDGGRTITFHLRTDGRWTNGDPLTAHDYVNGWRYNLAELRPGPPLVFRGIIGAEAYTMCDPNKKDCEALWEGVGVKALDDSTLEVRLAEPQPWFPSLVGGRNCLCFSPIHAKTVERYGEDWAKPEHIVTSGPFKLVEWKRGESMTLAKDVRWRDAATVALERVEVRFLRDDETAAALEAGEIDVAFAAAGLTTDTTVYPQLLTEYVGLDVDDIPDARQRRAMALVVDRRTIANKVYDGTYRPATSLTADGAPDFERIGSHFLQVDSGLAEARRLMSEAAAPRRAITLWLADVPEWRAAAAELRVAWSRLGIETTIKAIPEWEEYWRLADGGQLGDAFLSGWGYDFPHPVDFLDVWRCGSLSNHTGFCDRAYDRLLERAAREADEDVRLDLYAEAEAFLTGATGAMPGIPIAWGGLPMVERSSVRETFVVNPAGQIDLTRVRFVRR